MRVRDRLIVAVIAAVVVIGAVWLLLVSPERSKVSSLQSQIDSEQATLATAQSALASARATAAGYVGDVRAISQVMTAVPPTPGEPDIVSLFTKLAGKSVDVHELDVGGSGGTPVSLALTFTFHANYGSLQSMLDALDDLIATDGTNISATGRLVTINSISLSALPPDGTDANVSATVYSQAAAPATGATGATASPTTPAGAAAAAGSAATAAGGTG